MDRWSARIGQETARRFSAIARFPFGGPPYAPFLRWARRSGAAWPSPLGMLVHARRGLWVGYRFALELPRDPGLPAPAAEARPCEACAGRPCLAACPVDAFRDGGYDVKTCAAHLESAAGAECRDGGCLARRACPVGAALRPPPAQAAFHMAAFLRSRRREREDPGAAR